MKFRHTTRCRLTAVFTLFLPGIESAASEAMPRMPALERLLARGRARPLGSSPWDFLAAHAGGDTRRWPVGPVSALGELGTAPRACLRVEPLGADAEQQGLFRLPATILEITRLEAGALATAFRETFDEDGLRLEIAVPERWYLAWNEDHANAKPWQGFAGPASSMREGDRPAPAEAGLRRLLSEIEMLFHGHPVNAARRERGLPTIAGLHAWGGGVLSPGEAPAATGSSAIEEPYLAGLRRLAALPHVAAARTKRDAIGAGGVAWPLPFETLDPRQMASIELEWAAPLLSMLRRGRLDGVRVVTGRAIHETRRTDALRIWRRARPVVDLC